MIFSSIAFLFYFLPLVLLLHYFPGNRFRNATLLVLSLIAYAYGEKSNLLFLACMIILNYLFGLVFALLDARMPGQRTKTTESTPCRLPWFRGNPRKWVLAASVAVNLGGLIFYKYTGWLLSWVPSIVLRSVSIDSDQGILHAPLAISFFTFHALSYLIDIYRREAPVQRSLLSYGLYISLFPKMLAGPIHPYREAQDQLQQRTVSPELFLAGMERFIAGLAKKALLANPLAAFADKVFSIPAGMLSTEVSWLGLASYTLQIYYDFSGYTDMAIGLGQMFGFRLPENFSYPYVSRSIREFWRRWHISLSNWFRDYLYIPLGGNRCSPLRQQRNLVVVFFLCGLWHGASWNFVIWGLWHGAFLILERTSIAGSTLNRLWPPLRHLYVLLVVMLSWVFFRCDTPAQSVKFFTALSGMGAERDAALPLALYVNWEWILCMVVGAVGSIPLRIGAERLLNRIGVELSASHRAPNRVILPLRRLISGTLFVLSCMALAGITHNPFIYLKF